MPPRIPFTSAIAVLLLACGGGEVTVVVPPPPPPIDTRLVFVPDPEDAAAAQALGWTAIPDVEVTILPSDSSAPPQIRHSNAAGVLVLTGFPAGSYIIEARRWLSAPELAQLPANEDVVGWVAKAGATVSPTQAEVTLQVPASRKRGLVISEWAFNSKGDYYFAGFLELYNNADTTIYLDGMIIGDGFAQAKDYPNFPCSIYEPIWNDPLGIWSQEFQQFPGRGRDFPVPSGHIVVVATDAFDHRSLIGGGLDLSQADFEFSGFSDADNPGVPNLIDIGLRTNPFGHGLNYHFLASLPYVVLPVDADLLPRTVPPRLSIEWVRMPAADIVEAVAIHTSYLTGDPLCPQLVHRRFDRRESHARGTRDPVEEFEYSISRQRVPGQGRAILQHTRTSYADFVRTQRSPGALMP